MATTNDLATNTLAVVLAGGKGTRLDPLTRGMCKPALPIGGAFRSIDFSLSNCVNSGVRTVGVPTQYKPGDLLAHLDRAWSRAGAAGARVIAWRADERAPRLGYRGTADAVYRNLELIHELGHRFVLILAGDHVYKMDYRPMLELHCAQGAGVTIGCVEVPVEDARHFGVLAVGSAGRIERFVEKPRTRAELPEPSSDVVLASTGIYVFDTDFLARVLTIDAFTPESRHDFGGDVLPRLIRDARAFAYLLRGTGSQGSPYWRDIGTLAAFWRTHMELVGPTPLLTLDDPAWPLRSGRVTPPRSITTLIRTSRGGSIEDSVVADARAVAGHVARSVLFNDVEVAPAASVVDSVVLPGARVAAGCRLRGVVVDNGYRVPEGTVLEQDCLSAPAFEPVVLSAHDRPDAAAAYAVAL